MFQQLALSDNTWNTVIDQQDGGHKPTVVLVQLFKRIGTDIKEGKEIPLANPRWQGSVARLVSAAVNGLEHIPHITEWSPDVIWHTMRL